MDFDCVFSMCFIFVCPWHLLPHCFHLFGFSFPGTPESLLNCPSPPHSRVAQLMTRWIMVIYLIARIFVWIRDFVAPPIIVSDNDYSLSQGFGIWCGGSIWLILPDALIFRFPLVFFFSCWSVLGPLLITSFWMMIWGLCLIYSPSHPHFPFSFGNQFAFLLLGCFFFHTRGSTFGSRSLVPQSGWPFSRSGENRSTGLCNEWMIWERPLGGGPLSAGNPLFFFIDPSRL